MTDGPLPDIDISEDQWRTVRDILRSHVPHMDVFAFGSRAKRTAKPYSDLDVVLMTRAPLPISTTAALAEAFSESDLPWKVDIVDWAATTDAFRTAIASAKVLLQQSTKATD